MMSGDGVTAENVTSNPAQSIYIKSISAGGAVKLQGRIATSDGYDGTDRIARAHADPTIGRPSGQICVGGAAALAALKLETGITGFAPSSIVVEGTLAVGNGGNGDRHQCQRRYSRLVRTEQRYTRRQMG